MTNTSLIRQLGIDTQYVLLGFPLAIVTIVLCVVGFGLGVGLAVLWVGVPLLMVALTTARGFATLERVRIAPVLRRQMPLAVYKRPSGPGFWRRVLTPMIDGQAWLDLLHGTFRIIPSTVAFAVAVTWWAGALGGLSYLLWGWTIPHGADNPDLPELLGMGSAYSTRAIFYTAAGIFFAGTLIPVVRGVALLEALFARGLLSGVNELRTQVAVAEAARDTAPAGT